MRSLKAVTLSKKGPCQPFGYLVKGNQQQAKKRTFAYG